MPADPDEKEKIRLAFTERALRPTYSELSNEFNVPISTIGKWSAQDNWIALRTAFLERKCTEGDAMSVVLEAATRVNRPVIAAITNAVILAVQKLSETLDSIDSDVQKSPSTRAQIINTCSFALNNVANACKTIGIVGFPKELKELGSAREGGWTPALQQQINLTIQNAVTGKPEVKADVQSTGV